MRLPSRTSGLVPRLRSLLGRRPPLRKLHRIIVEIALPPPLAVVIVLVSHPRSYRAEDILTGLPALLFAAYAFALLPCLAYAAVMELWFAKGIQDRCGPLCTAGVSSLLGTGAGYVIQLLIPGGGIVLLPIGALDGMLVGAYLAYRYRPKVPETPG